MHEFKFTTHKLNSIYNELYLRSKELMPGMELTFSVFSPDLQPQLFNGETTSFQGQKYRHRNLKCWLDLAEMLNCRMLMPEVLSDGLVKIRFQLLSTQGWHHGECDNISEKYGKNSLFFRLDKSEEAAFLYDFSTSIKNLKLDHGCKVLSLGCHRGTEFQMLHDLDSTLFKFENFTGIDHSQSAIEQGKKDFPGCRLIAGDIQNLPNLLTERFDLIISIGTLQSPGIDSKKLFMQLVQDYLQPQGSVLIGQPNCRYLESEIKYGAVTKNRQDGELGLAIGDLFFYKKYLQQHKFNTYLRGKYYLFLSAQKSNISVTVDKLS